jgi:hypothetical protein
MNYDTIGEYADGVRAHYTDWHSAIYSAIWHVAIVAGLRSPGWAMAADLMVLLTGLYLLLRIGLPRPWAVLGATAVLAYPPILAFAVMIGTDTWFLVTITCAFGFVARAARTRDVSRRVSVVLAVVFALLAEAARPTAAPAMFALGCALAVVVLPARFRGWRRAVGSAGIGAATCALAVAAILGVQQVVLRADQVHPEQSTYKADLVAMSVLEHGVLLPPEVYPRQDLAWLRYSGATTTGTVPVDINPLLVGPAAAIPLVVEGPKFDALQRAWLRAIRTHPRGYLRIRLDSARFQLAISGPATVVYYQPADPFGFRSLLPGPHRSAIAYTAVWTTGDAIGGPLQRVWVYVLALVVVTAASFLGRRRDTDLIVGLLGVAMLLYTVGLLLFSPGVTYRYMYPTVTIATVLLLISIVRYASWPLRGGRAVYRRFRTMLQYGTSISSS